MLQLIEVFCMMLAGVSAARSLRLNRALADAQARDRWRIEKEARLAALADAIVAVGTARILTLENAKNRSAYDAAQLQLRRATTDALDPWIEIDAIFDLADEPPGSVTNELISRALNDVANNVDHIRANARKTWRQQRREARLALH